MTCGIWLERVLVLIVFAVSQAEKWVAVPFYPAVGRNTYIKTRPPTPSSKVLPAPFVPVHNPYCHTYETNTSINLGAGGPHTREIMCRNSIPRNVSSCQVGIDTEPCSISDITTLNSNQALARQNAMAFSFFACQTLDVDHWYMDPRCDTECDRNNPQQHCDACQWDCRFGLQCFFTSGIPPMPFFETQPSTPPDDTSSSYCCETYERLCTDDGCILQYSMKCVLTPTIPSGSVTCSSQIQSTCTSSATSDDKGGDLMFHPPVCESKCLFPCTNSSLPIPDCVGTQCHPSARLQQCTVNFLANPEHVCQFGGLPIVYKDATSVDPVSSSHAVGQRALCTLGDTDCESNIHCLCIDTFLPGYTRRTCENHRMCNHGGTYFESLDPSVPPLCVCNIGRYGRFCELQTSGVDCNNGQESPPFPLRPTTHPFAS
jgi:hypothetical protein